MKLTGKTSFWVCLALFLATYLSLRVFWFAGDPGIPSVWEYGYNATDEGYYLDGGKEKFLWGFFVDLPRTEAFTYGFSAGTHWLSYLAHLAFGLSTWTWRIPFVSIYLLAWLSAFVYLARKSGAVHALLLCTAVSSMPLIVAYERTASNDVLIGALALMAYVLATGRARWRLFAAACVTGLIVLVKPSVWVLMPIVAAGVLQTPKFGKRWIDLAYFAAAAVACVAACRLLVAASVLPDAQRAGVGVWEIVRRTTTHYPLPDLFDFASHVKGLSAFPRDPSYALLGVSTVFVFTLPVAMAVKNAAHFRFNANTLLFFALPAYVAAINVMNTQYTHYFIPALMFLPVVVDAAAAEIGDEASEAAPRVKIVLLVLGFTVAACAVGLLSLLNFDLAPQLAQQFYSKIYNFPARNVWCATGTAMAAFVVAVVAVLCVLRGLGHARRHVWAWIVSSFCAASVVFAVLPAVQLAPYLHRDSTLYFAPMAVTLVATALLLVAVFGLKGGFLRSRRMTLFMVASFAVCWLVTPNWRAAAGELLRAPTYRHAEVARELAALLPADAVVIGERSNQMLMSLPIRTATTFAAVSDPIPVVKSILADNPHAKLYALADSQNAYNLRHYREHAKEYALHLVKTFKMPSFGTGEPADVYLCRIEVLPSASAAKGIRR